MESFPRPTSGLQPEERADRRTFLKSLAWLQTLPAAEIETIVANLSPAEYSQGETLFRQETTIVTHILLIRRGRLERSLLDDGEHRVTGILEPGDLYGGLSLLFNNGVSTSTVRSLEPVQAYLLDRENFFRLCARYPAFAKQFSSDRQPDGMPPLEQPSEEPAQPPEQDDLPMAGTSSRLRQVMHPVTACPAEASIRNAAELLATSPSGALLVLDGQGSPLGLITDTDLRSKVILEGRSLDQPAQSILSRPLIQLGPEADLSEALLSMLQHSVGHLAVADGGRVQGLISERDLLLRQSRTPALLLRTMQAAQSLEQIKAAYATLPGLIGDLVRDGTRAAHLNRIITTVTDQALNRLMDMALSELGPPPVDFAFLLLGSEGRREQTLKTDQDNALIFEDVPGSDEAEVRRYFLQLGTRVCDWLHDIGQVHCEFEIMAKNPTWCQPLSRWKEYHRKWIESDDPERLLRANIFFDFRCGYGRGDLVDALHSALFERLAEWPGFLRHLARNTLHFKPPLDFFGNFSLQERGQRKDGLDIKSAMRLVVDVARIYALQESISETNTTARLQAVHEQNGLDREELDDLVHAYEFLMYQRLKHQAESIAATGGPPDNYLLPKHLTHIEQQALKEAFKRIRTGQGKMRLDFFLHFP
jgi:CBS domain-containing protein